MKESGSSIQTGICFLGKSKEILFTGYWCIGIGGTQARRLSINQNTAELANRRIQPPPDDSGLLVFIHTGLMGSGAQRDRVSD